MSVQSDMQTLLQKKMDRRQFLKHVGVGFIAILGVGALLRTLQTLGGSEKGYSAGTYGGKKESSSSQSANRG